MNHMKLVFWVNTFVIIGISHVLIGKDYISYYDREPTVLEDFVYSSIGKSYTVESDFINEQSPTHVAFEDKARKNPIKNPDNETEGSKQSSKSHSYEIEYAPAINDLPYVDNKSHQSVQIRALPKASPDDSFVESEYAHSEFENKQHGGPQYQLASYAADPKYHQATPQEFQSNFKLNPVSGNFYFVDSNEPQKTDSHEQYKETNEIDEPSKQLAHLEEKTTPEEKRTKIDENAAKDNSDQQPLVVNSSEEKNSGFTYKINKSQDVPAPQSKIVAIESSAKKQKATDTNLSKKQPIQEHDHSPAEPEIAMGDKIEKTTPANHDTATETRKNDDLIAYSNEFETKSHEFQAGTDGSLQNIEDNVNDFDGISFDRSCGDCCGLPKFCLFLDYTLGKGVGYPTGYTSIGLWSAFNPLRDNTIQPFVDLRGHVLNNGQKAANIGLGARYLNSCLNTIFGLNVYYDYRQGKCRSNYNQIGVGAEVLGACWDFRFNGYIPVGNRDCSSCCLFEEYDGDYYALFTKKERSLAGFDAEVGAYLRRKNPCNCCDFDLYAAIGPYYFSTSRSPNVFGGEVRLLASWLNCVNVEVIATSDRVFHQRVQGRFEISIPLGGSCCFWESNQDTCGNCSCWPRCVDCLRVWRREIIALETNCNWCTNFSHSDESSDWGSDKVFSFSSDFESESFSSSRSNSSW